MKPFWYVEKQGSVFSVNCRFEIEGKIVGLVEFLPDSRLGSAAHNEAILIGTIEYMTRRKEQFIAGVNSHA